jgi:uncharacterized repeat protein (TIGR02543 family)
MGVLSKALAIMLAVNMAVMLALPIGVFADDIIISGDGYEVEYGDDAGGTEAEPQSEPAAEPEAESEPAVTVIDSGVGIQPMAITPFAVTTVYDWVALRNAIRDATPGDTIRLGGNIQRPNANSGSTYDLVVSKDNITIDGGGNTLNFRPTGGTTTVNRAGFQLASTTTLKNFTLRNITIARDNATTYPLISANGNQTSSYRNAATANWNISIADLSTTGTITSGLISASDSVVSFSGNVSWEIEKGAANSFIWNTAVRGVTFEQNSKVTLKAGGDVIVAIPATQTANTLTYIELKPGAQVNLHSYGNGSSATDDGMDSHHSAILMNQGANDETITGEQANKARALLRLSGANTSLYCSSDGNGRGYYGGVVVIAGGAGGGVAAANNGHVAVDISGGAKLEVMSNGAMPAMVQQVPSATLKVTGSGSELKLTTAETSSAGDWDNLRATLRFRYVGAQTLDVSDHANLSITKLADVGTGRPAAIRFGKGEYNSFYVTSGATVRIENQGNGSYYDADVANPNTSEGPGVGDNAAIEFDADYFTFDVSGEGSAIELIAAQGPAVDAGDKKYGKIVVGKDAIFQAKGSTKSDASVENSAIFKAGSGFTFETNEPLYYDFQNARDGGGRIFNISSGSSADLSTFTSTHSDVAIWGNGLWGSQPYQPVSGDPNQRWTGITYKLSGPNFNTPDPSNDPDFTAEFGPYGMTSYTRVSGNNSLPVIQSFLDLTNADKHVRVTGIVPEGLPTAPPRAIWTDEAWARLLINGTGQPVSMKSYNVDELYDVQAASPANGVLRYDKGSFLVPGDTYTVTAAWRGPTDNPSDSRNHAARTQDIQSGTATVRDVTPPAPVTIDDHSDDIIWAGQPDQLTLTGDYADMSTVAYNSEPITKIYAKVMRNTTSGSTVVYDGSAPNTNNWAALNTMDRTWSITLPSNIGWQEDDILYVIAMDSNDLENPLVATDFHDTKFPAATSLTVKDFPIELSATNKLIGLTELRALQTGSAATQAAALKNLIGATATLKPGKTNPFPNLNVSITESQGILTEANTYQAWMTKYNNDDPKSFTITYQLDSYQKYTATAIVTVVPRDTVGPVAANDIGFSQNNAIDFLDKTTAEQYAYLLTATDAIGVDFNEVTGEVDYVYNDVHVVNHGIQPSVSTPPNHYPINFARNSDPTKTGSAKARVIAGNTPVLNVTTPIRVWTGSLGATMPSGFITVAAFDAMAGVTATDEDGTDIIDKVEITSNVGLALGSDHKFSSTPLKGVYEIDYKLTNDDNNTITAYRVVLVDVFDDGGYVVDGYDFVATKTEVTNAGTAGKEQLVKDLSKGQAWRIIKVNPSETIPVSVPLVFKNNTLNPFTNIEADYPIQLGVNAVSPLTGNPIVTVTGKVVDKSEIGRGGDDATHTYYAIAANNVERPVPQMVGKTGTGTDVANWLKAQALPDAYRITGANTITQLSRATDITVFSNQIPANPVSGQTYDVTFEVSGVKVTVGFTAKGSDPIINFDIGTTAYDSGSPLVIQQTPGSAHLLTDAELKAKMTVTDAEDLNGADLLANHTAVEIRGGGSVVPNIDTQNVAVYSVKYTVTDSDGMGTSATRAIVVTDGRYVIDKGLSANPDDGLILGAKNFVKQSVQVDGTQTDVINSSFAAAYTETGTSILNLSVNPWPVAGYVYHAGAGAYDFTLTVPGYSLTKSITGIVTAADVLFPGFENDQYAIAASHFAKNVLDAEAMVAGGDLAGAEITAADVRVYMLVDTAPAARAYVFTDSGFPGGPPVVQKPNASDPNPFTLTFGIEKQDVNDPSSYITVVTAQPSRVTINASISQGGLPEMTLTTPIEVALGGTFDHLAGVGIVDAEDSPILPSAAIITPSPTGGVDTNAPGIYTMSYLYTDTDNNPVSKQRSAVVNDGHYAVSNDANLENGRVLYASSFVVKSSDVADDAQARPAQIKSLAGVELYNGITGAQEDASSLVTVLSSSSYGPTAGTYYDIALQAIDAPSGAFTKNINAKVVATDVLVPSTRNKFGSTTYVYGSDLPNRTVSQAEAIAAGGTPGIIAALKAGATKVMPNGALTDLGVTIVDHNDFYTRLTNSITTDDHGAFTFTVTDAEGVTSLAVLTITVTTGSAPELSMNKPLEINMPVAAASLDGSGNLTRDQILSGVQVTDIEDITIPLTAVTYDIADANGQPVSAISGTVPGLYKVTYYVSDSDHNPAIPVSRAIVVNDGRFACDGNYVISALSFIINKTKVTTGTAYNQIIDESGAKAWDSSGNAANAYVVSSGYTDSINTYPTNIGVQGYSSSSLSKPITAMVIEDANTATPGAHVDDGNSDNGDRYAIYAHNFRINVVDAKALALQGQAAYAASLITRAGATSYNRATPNLGAGGTVAYVSDGGFAAAATIVEGNTFEITFKVAQDDDATVTIKAFVSNAGAPVINVPDREVWIGDPLDPDKTPGSVLPSQFNYITTGPVTVNDDIDTLISSKLKYGTYDEATQTFTEVLAPINFATAVAGDYQVAYSVTDSDYNTTIVVGLVTLNDGSIVRDRDYAVRAFNFVTTEDSITAAADKNGLILDLSYAQAWRYDKVTNGSVTTIVTTPVTPVVKSDAGFAPTAGEYTPIQIGVVAQYPYSGDPIQDIKGTVIDRDVIAQGPATGDIHYVVAANNIILPYSEAASYGGAINPANSGLLINAAKAVAYKITNETVSHGVTVVSSTIPAAPQSNTDYKVKFSPTDAPSVVIEINVRVNEGGLPVIQFDDDPLVIAQVPAATPNRYMTEAELKARITIIDIEDSPAYLLAHTQVYVPNANPNVLPQIDKYAVGVYPVAYTVTDSQGNTATGIRAVVINDGRFEIIDENNDGQNDIIIGARDFVLLASESSGQLDQVVSASKVNIYDRQGTRLTPILQGNIPAEYISKVLDKAHPFTWTAAGHSAATKTITGTLVGGDVIYPGDDNDQYSIVANHFSKNTVEANLMVGTGDLNAELIAAANVRIFKLVSTAPNATARVVSNGGFSATPNAAGYQIYFGAKTADANVPAPPTRILVSGKVTDGEAPELEVSTPLEVWIGDPASSLRSSTSILPADYNDKYGVTAYDVEDTNLSVNDVVVTYVSPTTGVDLTVAGTYVLDYKVTDSDFNEVTKRRVVAVNDGTIVVGEQRILYATSFATLAKNVTGDLDQLIISLSRAHVIDAETGLDYGPAGVTVESKGSFSATPGDYPITLATLDGTTGNKLIKSNIIGRVVPGGVIGPENPNPNGPTTYVYGDNLEVNRAEAMAIADGGITKLKADLLAAATKVLPDGSVNDIDVNITDTDSFIAKLASPNDDLTDDLGIFNFTVTDVEDQTSIHLTINVSDGNQPTLTSTPKPLSIPMKVQGSPALTPAEIMAGVVATDMDEITPANPTGDITNTVTYEVKRDDGTVVTSAVPSDVAAVYQVTYTVRDSDLNTRKDTRALIVNDGSFIYNTEYILSARHFVVGASEVNTFDLSGDILIRSNARAWSAQTGIPATAEVAEVRGYKATPGTYFPKIQVAGHPALNKQIDALVINDGNGGEPDPGDGNGGNGDQYSITANNFRLNTIDAETLAAQSDQDIANRFLLLADVRSYDRTASSLVRTGTPELIDDGGFKAAAGTFQDDDSFRVTFWVNEDHSATVDAWVLISGGEGPKIQAPDVRVVWIGDPADPDRTPGSVLPSEFHYINTGPVTVTDDYDNDTIAASLRYGSDTNPDPNVVDFVEGTPVNLGKAGNYKVTYTATDSDYNTAYKTVIVTVDDGRIKWDGDYGVAALDFVTTAANVAAAGADINALTLSLSHAEAWVKVKTTDPSGLISDIEIRPTTPVVKAGSMALVAVVGTYSPINIGVEAQAPYQGNPISTISAEVLDKDIISNKPAEDDNGTPNDPSDDVILTPPDANDQDQNNPNDNARYVVGAKNVALRYYEVADFVGLDPIVKARLITRAAAEAFKISGDGSVPFDVDVTVNDISANADAGDSFYVTFIVKGIPSVYAKAKFTVTRGNAPVLDVGNPLMVEATETTALLSESVLRDGVTATDVEDIDLTSRIVITEPGTNHLPTIDTAVPGIYTVLYTVTDSDGTTTSATRPVTVNDGRYIPVDEDNDGKIDFLIGAKNFVVKQADCSGEIAQAKALSYVEVYSAAGVDLSSQVELVGGVLPQGYINKELGTYSLTWALQGHPAVAYEVFGTIIANDSIVTPIDKTSAYAIVAKNFTVNTNTAATINTDAQYINYASARVIKLVEAGIDRQVALVDNGGFKPEQGSYRIVFGAGGIATSKLSSAVTARVTDGSAPLIATDSPIVIPTSPAGTPVIDLDQILQAGNIKVVDSEAVDPVNNPTGDITSSAVLVDNATGQLPSIAADQPGVYQVVVKVVDSDGNEVEKSVAVVVDDGNFVFTTPRADGTGFILRAHGFDIGLSDVIAARPVEQIREQSELQAWRNDGGQIVASIIDTGGYKDAAGTYTSVVGIYDTTPGAPPVLVGSPDLSKPIQVRVVDDYTRSRVTFDANGGILVGPRVITVVSPQTTLPYLPASPIRDGYTFRYWSTSASGGTQFTADTTITADLTLYAIWTANPVTPPPAVTPPPNVIVNTPGTTVGGGTTNVVVEPPAQNITIEEGQTPEDSGTGETIDDEETPKSMLAGWALFDLLATILALILLVVFFIKFFFDRPRDEEYEEEPIDAQLWEAMSPDQRAQYQARREADYQTWQADQQRKTTRQKALYVNAPVVLIVGVAFVEALIVLFTTQNFGLPMSTVGNYSVIFALIVFVQLLTPMVAAIIRNNHRENQKMGPSQPATEDGGLTL